MNTQILYTVLFVTDNRYFKYIYIMLIKLISWKRFTNCFDLDIWYFFKQLWFQKTHTHTCICFSHSGTNCHPYSMCIYMNYHGSIMRVSSRSWCHNKLILSLATVYDNQNPVTLATSWYDSIWNLFYIKDVGSHSFLQLCDFHEKFTRVRINTCISKSIQRTRKIERDIQCKKWPCLTSTSFLWGTCQNATCRYFSSFFLKVLR